MSSFLSRVASAPISWGVCEVPGWGAMLPSSRVLPEMSNLGFAATELGAPGFLPERAEDVAGELSSHGMSLIGAFTPLVVHDRAQREKAIADARATAQFLQAAGATKFVSSLVQDDDWSIPEKLTSSEQAHMAEMLGIVDEICEEHGLQQVLHPHVQTLVETKDDISRVLDSCDVSFCLDTGHMAFGGQDPVEFAQLGLDRVGHVHLKDIRVEMTGPVLQREVSLMEATQNGIFTNLGAGDVDILGVVQTLESAGYEGWYVIEQDTALTAGFPAEGEGPSLDVSASLDYLTRVVAPTLEKA